MTDIVVPRLVERIKTGGRKGFEVFGERQDHKKRPGAKEMRAERAKKAREREEDSKERDDNLITK